MNKKNGLIFAAAVIVILCVTALFFIGKEKKTGTETENAGSASETVDGTVKNNDDTVISEGESLIIPVSEVTSEASFFKVEVDGTTMEIIAVRGSDDSIRTAFNICQVCYDSGRGYYVQDGDFFVCQNCGSRFTVDDIQIKSGGCNPWPIFEEDKITTDESVEITYDFLAKSKDIFANWKRSY